MTNYSYWYDLAKKASDKIKWIPQVIFTHWYHETGGFVSNNLIHNNNIAGQTWYAQCGYPKGTLRPIKEGGYYIKYPDPVTGYTDFILKNQRRYGTVSTGKTVEEQFQDIKKGGWATDPKYVSKLISLYKELVSKNIIPEYEPPSVHPELVKYTSIVDYLKDHHLRYDFVSRRKLAEKHGIVGYSGTAEQNMKLLKILQG